MHEHRRTLAAILADALPHRTAELGVEAVLARWPCVRRSCIGRRYSEIFITFVTRQQFEDVWHVEMVRLEIHSAIMASGVLDPTAAARVLRCEGSKVVERTVNEMQVWRDGAARSGVALRFFAHPFVAPCGEWAARSDVASHARRLRATNGELFHPEQWNSCAIVWAVQFKNEDKTRSS